VSPIIPAFAAPYAARSIGPINPATDEIFTMRPYFRFAICRAAIWLQKNVPVRFTSTCFRQSAGAMSRKGALFSTPALLTRISRRPSSLAIRVMAALTPS
jgi:hypothetical protein